jgi:peptidoglycan hydrolase-like protein with peptidoglycan-binding domain
VSAQKGSETPSAKQSNVTSLFALREGAKGERVRKVQGALQRLGFDPGEYDGVFGVKTKEAVVALQRKLGVHPSGIWDDGLARAVTHELQAGEVSIFRDAPMTAALAVRALGETPAAPATTTATSSAGGLQALLRSPWFWASAGLGVVLLAGRGGRPTVEIEGIEELTGRDEEDAFEVAEVAPKRKRKRRKKAKPRGSPASGVGAHVGEDTSANESVTVDVTPTRVTVKET